MVCNVCGKAICLANIYDGKYHCAICYIRKFPPILVLTVPWDAPLSLYNPKTELFERDTKQELEHCGFILFTHKIFRSREINSKYKELLVFRYKGMIKCGKISGYTWPAGMRPCINSTCGMSFNFV